MKKLKNLVDKNGLLLSVSEYAAHHHEVTLFQLSFGFYMTEATPEKMIGDKARDSDPLYLYEELAEQCIKIIAWNRLKMVGN